MGSIMAQLGRLQLTGLGGSAAPAKHHEGPSRGDEHLQTVVPLSPGAGRRPSDADSVSPIPPATPMRDPGSAASAQAPSQYAAGAPSLLAARRRAKQLKGTEACSAMLAPMGFSALSQLRQRASSAAVDIDTARPPAASDPLAAMLAQLEGQWGQSQAATSQQQPRRPRLSTSPERQGSCSEDSSASKSSAASGGSGRGFQTPRAHAPCGHRAPGKVCVMRAADACMTLGTSRSKADAQCLHVSCAVGREGMWAMISS